MPKLLAKLPESAQGALIYASLRCGRNVPIWRLGGARAPPVGAGPGPLRDN